MAGVTSAASLMILDLIRLAAEAIVYSSQSLYSFSVILPAFILNQHDPTYLELDLFHTAFAFEVDVVDRRPSLAHQPYVVGYKLEQEDECWNCHCDLNVDAYPVPPEPSSHFIPIGHLSRSENRD